MALAASTLCKLVPASLLVQRFVRLVAAQWEADHHECELGRVDLVLAGGEEAREAGVEGGAQEHRCC